MYSGLLLNCLLLLKKQICSKLADIFPFFILRIRLGNIDYVRENCIRSILLFHYVKQNPEDFVFVHLWDCLRFGRL